jgi:hypothetical protein
MAIHFEDLSVASPVIAQEEAYRLEKVLTPPERHQFIDRREKVFTSSAMRFTGIRLAANKKGLVEAKVQLHHIRRQVDDREKRVWRGKKETPGDSSVLPVEKRETPGDSGDLPGGKRETPGGSSDLPGEKSETPGSGSGLPGEKRETPGGSSSLSGGKQNALYAGKTTP